MNGRDAILGKIRSQIGVKGGDTSRRAKVANRLSGTPKGIIPKRGQLPHFEQVELFRNRATSVQASVTRVASYEDVPEEITAYLRLHNLPQIVRTGEDIRLDSAPWNKVPTLERTFGPAIGADTTGLSHATAGVAETGTLVMTSGTENPTSVNFLPENHIVVIAAADIEGDYEAALGRIRETYGQGRMPRTVNMITGPSRSGDIEQTILLGAHGPRNLHIIVVGD